MSRGRQQLIKQESTCEACNFRNLLGKMRAREGCWRENVVESEKRKKEDRSKARGVKGEIRKAGLSCDSLG